MTAQQKEDAITTQVADLHAAYCAAVGFQLRRNVGRDMAWRRFLHAEFTRADLVKVVAYLKREISQGKRNDGCLKFSNLIDAENGFNNFEEDLGLASKFLKLPAKTTGKPATPRTTPPRAAWTLWFADQYPDSDTPAEFADLPDYVQEEYFRP